MKKAIRGIEYFAVRLLAALANSLSEKSALMLGASLGNVVFRLAGKRKSVVRTNIRICRLRFPDDHSEKLFVRRCFQHISVTAIEVLRERSYAKRDYLAKVEYLNEPPFREVVDIGKGCLLMSGHFGNWELLGTYVRNRGFPVDLLVKRQSNHEVDEYLNNIRRSQGVGIIYTDSGARALLQSMRDGRFIAILADQYGGADSVKVSFFGADVMVPTGPAVLLQKYGIPMVFGTGRRAKTGKHYLKTELHMDFTDMSRTEIVQMYTTLLEEAVREHPEMWLWTHRRFKNITDYSGVVS